MKLTKTQFKTISTILYNNSNKIETYESDYNNKVLKVLTENKLILSTLTGLIFTNQGFQIYKENIKKGKVFGNIKDKETRIEIYRILENDTYEFIYFMTKGKTGGGKISLIDLCKDYVACD